MTIQLHFTLESTGVGKKLYVTGKQKDTGQVQEASFSEPCTTGWAFRSTGPQLFMPYCHGHLALMPRSLCPAITGLLADVGKGRACPPRWLDGELLLLVRAFCPVQRRRTDAVLLLRSTAALVGPAGPFPPIRPKDCRRIALSVRATVAKYPSPCYRR